MSVKISELPAAATVAGGDKIPSTQAADSVTRRITVTQLLTDMAVVTGPGTATDNAIPRYNLTTGKILQDSGVTIGDNNVVNFPAGIKLPIETVAVQTTLGPTHHTLLVNAVGGAVIIDLPAAASNSGVVFVVKKIDASGNTVTIDGNASETIDGATTQVISSQWDSITLHCNGTGWFIL